MLYFKTIAPVEIRQKVPALPSAAAFTLFLAATIGLCFGCRQDHSKLHWDTTELKTTGYPGDEPARLTFSFENDRNRPVKFRNSIVSCQCLEVLLPPGSIPSDEKGTVLVKCHFGQIPGQFRQSATVYFDESSERRSEILNVIINVQPPILPKPHLLAWHARNAPTDLQGTVEGDSLASLKELYITQPVTGFSSKVLPNGNGHFILDVRPLDTKAERFEVLKLEGILSNNKHVKINELLLIR